MALADHLDFAILNHFFRGVPAPAPAAVFVALFNGHPDKGGAEIFAEGYERIPMAFSAPAKDELGRFVANAEYREYPRARSDWGQVTHFVVFDGRVGGTAIFGARLKRERVVREDDKLYFEKGDLRIQYLIGAGE
jgi:hypothetical protein